VTWTKAANPATDRDLAICSLLSIASSTRPIRRKLPINHSEMPSALSLSDV